jgi:hypothetical protein
MLADGESEATGEDAALAAVPWAALDLTAADCDDPPLQARLLQAGEEAAAAAVAPLEHAAAECVDAAWQRLSATHFIVVSGVCRVPLDGSSMLRSQSKGADESAGKSAAGRLRLSHSGRGHTQHARADERTGRGYQAALFQSLSRCATHAQGHAPPPFLSGLNAEICQRQTSFDCKDSFADCPLFCLFVLSLSSVPPVPPPVCAPTAVLPAARPPLSLGWPANSPPAGEWAQRSNGAEAERDSGDNSNRGMVPSITAHQRVAGNHKELMQTQRRIVELGIEASCHHECGLVADVESRCLLRPINLNSPHCHAFITASLFLL